MEARQDLKNTGYIKLTGSGNLTLFGNNGAILFAVMFFSFSGWEDVKLFQGNISTILDLRDFFIYSN